MSPYRPSSASPFRIRTLRRGPIVCLFFALWAVSPALSGSHAVNAAPKEYWDSIYFGNAKVGHIHTRITPIQSSGKELVRVEVFTEMNVQRERDTSKMSFRYGSIEDAEGTIVRLESRLRMGPQEMRITGEVKGDKLNVALESGGQSTKQTLDFPPDTRGPYGPELSMQRKPMKPGEVREISIFLPELTKLARARLEAKSVEPLSIAGKQVNLLRIESKVTFLDGKLVPGTETTYFADAQGQIIRTLTDAFGGMATYRTTKDAALSKSNAVALDLITNTIVKTKSRITNSERTRNVIYDVSMDSTDLSTVIMNDDRQKLIKNADGKGYRLEVKTQDPKDPAKPNAAAVTVGKEYLKAGPLVNSEDPNIQRMAKTAVGTLTDPLEKAKAITLWVNTNIKEKNFETSFATASEVAKTLSGDCTEHAVLAAAMCRAVNLPSRGVVGLVYVDRLRGFGFHMWNEVFLNNRWIAVDAAFGQVDVDATHIKLAETSLDGISPFEQFLPVTQVSNKIAINPVELR